ncbi:hypothetical protein Tco_1051416 [Tanacetum coccineum]
MIEERSRTNGLETGRYAVSTDVGYGVLGFLGVRTTFDIFQKLRMDTLYLLDGYGVSVFRIRPWHRNGDDDVVDSVVGCRRGGCDDGGGVDVVTWVEVVVLVWGGSGGDGGDNGMAVVASGGE